ncbi:MAG: hypothetical protein IID61_17105 [SAR324 cluster bacterium]|nr:hypothetical protein [SAR324 cluster bacterium]
MSTSHAACRSILTIVMAFAFLFSALTQLKAQEEKPDAAVAPLAALGAISQGEKTIIFNRLQAELSKHYKLVPQEDYFLAEERAFAELEADQCTEEQCIRKIQEILQVERLFVLQVIREQPYTQLSLNLVREGEKIVREVTCDSCSLFDLNDLLPALVAEIVGAEERPVARPRGGAGILTLFGLLRSETPWKSTGTRPRSPITAPIPCPPARTRWRYCGTVTTPSRGR